MKVLMFLAAIAFATLSNAGEYTAASASGYKCKDMGDSVCAVSVTTGQCTQEWDEDDGGLFQCQKWTGEVKVKPVDKSKYTCKAISDGACAVNQSTGQCGPSWSDDDGGMNQCQKWTGEVKVKAINKSKYVCKKTTNGYCAQNTITGQCGHEWSDDDGDAKFFCKKWINQ